MRCGLIDGAADGDGRITGPDTIKFFGMSKLSRPDLKQVRAAPFLFCLAGGADDFFFFSCDILSSCFAIQGLGYCGLQAAGVPGFPRIRRGNAGFGVSVEGVAPSSPWDLPASGLLSGEPRACALLCCPRSLHDLFGARYFSSGVGSGFGYISLVYLTFAPCVVSSWSPVIQGDV
jgi:hypothetical protein